ncbi:MAG: FadR/GntR family transcriptional regulator [Saezia sp.]
MENGIKTKQRVEETSFSFHTEVIRASGNQVLLMITYFISELQRQSRYETLWDSQHRHDAYDFHREIYDKIKSRDGDGAYKLMYEHLVHAKEFMLKNRSPEN